HSLESFYAHVPGLKVLSPATIEDARWMLAPALEDPDPVIIFEHAGLYNSAGDRVEDAGPVDIRSAKVRQPGDDITLIAYGGSVPKTIEAAQELGEQGVSAEVLDLRVLRPLDKAAILGSVAKTHRVVIVDEGWKTGGISAEIAALIVEDAVWELDGPIARVCSAEVPIPYARHMEQAALPQVPMIVDAARRLVGR
ncbi:MAG: transketolase C-terminal domain-containing protein, partial [Acidimicrobiia bacterium]